VSRVGIIYHDSERCSLILKESGSSALTGGSTAIGSVGTFWMTRFGSRLMVMGSGGAVGSLGSF